MAVVETSRKSHPILDDEFDPRPVDVWATGMVLIAMRTGKVLWGVALKNQDSHYTRHLGDRKLPSGFRPIERLPSVSYQAPILLVWPC